MEEPIYIYRAGKYQWYRNSKIIGCRMGGKSPHRPVAVRSRDNLSAHTALHSQASGGGTPETHIISKPQTGGDCYTCTNERTHICAHTHANACMHAHMHTSLTLYPLEQVCSFQYGAPSLPDNTPSKISRK